MAILATALRGTGWRLVGARCWSLLLAVMTVGGDGPAALSPRRASWAKVKLAKHLFEHRYDYRTEWLRFTETLGRDRTDAPPLGERIVKAFADIVDAPGGLLLVADDAGALIEPQRRGTGPARNPAAERRSKAPGLLARGRKPAAASSTSMRFASGWADAARPGARRARLAGSTRRRPGPACR